MFIQITWNIDPSDTEATENLYRSWESFTGDKLKSSGRAHQLMYEAGEHLTPISDDGNSGIVILHNNDGEPLSIAETQARAFAQSVNSSGVQSTYFSKVRSLRAKAIQENLLQSVIAADVITEEDIAEAEAAVVARVPELKDKPEERRQAALEVLEEAPTPSKRRGIPVRGRSLPRYPEGKPWEQTPEWIAELSEAGITPDDTMSKKVWMRHYNKHYSKTPKARVSHKKYTEGAKFQLIQRNYASRNPAGKEEYSEEYLASLTPEELARTGPDALINPRYRNRWINPKGTATRKVSNERVKARNFRNRELEQPYRERGEPIPDYEIQMQLWKEGWYPRQESFNPETGRTEPWDIERFNMWYNNKFVRRDKY